MKIYGDMHTHTIASTHAYSTIYENCKLASQYGLKGIAMTDHAMGMPDSPHEWHFLNMKCLPRKIFGVTVLRGMETNIMNDDGELDVDDDLLSTMEWVVSSMHHDCYKPTNAQNHTQAYINVCKNPYVDVIGHSASDEFIYDYEKGLRAVKEYGKLLEINESSIINKASVRKNYPEIIRICKKLEVPVVVDSDSHYCENIGQVPNAIKLLEEQDFPEKLILNSDWEKVREYVLKKRKNLDI